MSTAIGDLVVNLGMNTAPFGAAVSTAQGQMNNMNQSVEVATGKASGLARAEKSLGRGIEAIGMAVGTYNTSLGAMIAASGDSLSVLAMSTKTYGAFGKVIAQVTLAKIAHTAATIASTVASAAFWLVSNPVGWAIMAAGAIAAAFGYAYFANSVKASTDELKKSNDERQKSIDATVKSDMGPVAFATQDLGTQQKAYDATKENETYVVAGQLFYRNAESAKKLALAKDAVTLASQQLTQAQNKETEAATALAVKHEEARGDAIAAQYDAMWSSLSKLTLTAQAAERLGFIRKFKPSADALAMWDSLYGKIDKATKAAALTKGITDAEQAARSNIATQGLSPERRKIWELQQQGATPQQLKHLSAQATQMEEMQAGDKARGAGAALAEQMMTPMEQFKKKTADYKRLFSAGAIDANTFARANAGALAEITGKGAKEKPVTEFAKALDARSDEAWKTIVGAMVGDEKDQAAIDTAANTAEANRWLEKLVAANEGDADFS